MRIIGGEYRSRLIDMPQGTGTRPTQDRIRESVFNLVMDIAGKTVLDLFAGSGAYGIEALSRGASAASFVENDFRCIKTIERNITSLGIDKSLYTMIKANAVELPPRLAAEGKRFDLIFLDPPYYRDLARKTLINIDACAIVSPIGRVIVEHFKGDELSAPLATLAPEKERRYGDTVITVFKRITE